MNRGFTRKWKKTKFFLILHAFFAYIIFKFVNVMSEEILLGKSGAIVNYRQSKKIIHPRFAVLSFPGITTRAAAYQLIGHTVAWETVTGKEIKGKITRVHGNSGAVCAHFKDGGLPGQAFGSLIKIVK
jgi:ribosomal protein L35AE/L33A